MCCVQLENKRFKDRRLPVFKNWFLNYYSKDIWLVTNVGPGVVWPTGTLGHFPVVPKNLWVVGANDS